ncbi:hypothetical protein CcI49_14425 [Frankia sp. CcI49]|uniref:DUF6454 family protein n=1 Tax=Frankia sp. CcI49 TaxID=1745382 RepID=UPI000978BCE6|nr:DUF6454 family protein [Frankia sp. CcI49]ONH59908.1 hypothetical protein CcI49_14425 [Frankia sp. CcI49]
MKRSWLVRAAATIASVAVAGAVVSTSSATAKQPRRDDPATVAFAATTRSTSWTQVQKISLRFPTYHPQGLALVGDKIFLSTVEILEAPVRYPAPVDGYDRTPGRGVGHVLVLDRQGTLLKDVTLGEGTVYHPGGIDFDGTSVWVPVAEYRPNSKAIVYRLDPRTYRVAEAFRVNDHVGGVVRDRETGIVHGVSWGSRTLYAWSANGRQLTRQANEDHMLDYQDCDYAGAGKQICGGVTGLATATGGSYELGGIALRDLSDNAILHEVPFSRFSSAGHVVTRNPVALERTGNTLRLFTAPDDGEEIAGTELIVFESPVA